MASLPYHEPDITTLLVQSSFVFLLNVVNGVLDKALYCGLLGQVLLGVAWGAPGAHVLSDDAQNIVVQLGYLGLILLVYEGGLSVPIKSLKANLVLSSCVALVGVAAPIAFSFILMPLMDATPLQAFAAGAALCSTSLGTTFTVLKSSELAQTRLGVVLGTAAMIDDVIGLVIVQVIYNLGIGTGGVSGSIVIRPLLVSLAFALIVPLVCKLLLRKVKVFVGRKVSYARLQEAVRGREARVIVHLLVLFGFVAAGSYAGTSNLFTAYLAGVVINWWDTVDTRSPSQASPGRVTTTEERTGASESLRATMVPTGAAAATISTQVSQSACDSRNNQSTVASASSLGDCPKEGTEPRVDPVCLTDIESANKDLSGYAMYKDYLAEPAHRLLVPFFFASIGFSIPIASLFKGSLLWRGLIYATLMAFGKVVCGLWLLDLLWARKAREKSVEGWLAFCRLILLILPNTSEGSKAKAQPDDHGPSADATTEPFSKALQSPSSKASCSPFQTAEQGLSGEATISRHTAAVDSRVALGKPPLSLYPAAILGSAMIARGEIGFLIASIAESNCTWQPSTAGTATRSDESSAIFIVVTWAIFICTFMGPINVGLLVRRVRTLEKTKGSSNASRRGVLDLWLTPNI